MFAKYATAVPTNKKNSMRNYSLIFQADKLYIAMEPCKERCSEVVNYLTKLCLFKVKRGDF